MSFNPSTEDLWNEVQAAMRETAQFTHHTDDIIRRMCGRWYRRDQEALEVEPENFAYAFMSNMLPQLGNADPRVKVEAARVIGHKTVAQAMKDGLDAWIRDVHFAEAHEPVHIDFLTSRGVTLHFLDEDTRFSRGTVTPKVKRVDPRRFFMDALTDGPDEGAFRGHWYWVDVDDLLADEDVSDEVKQRVSPGGDTPTTEGAAEASPGQGKESAFGKKHGGDELGRKRVKCYSVWIRERNTIRVLCEASEVVELYPERPYYGPPNGPYQLYDAYPVPGQGWPLSPLVAVQDQSIDLNVHARAMGRAAARRKSLGLVEASNPDLAGKLTDAEDGEIVPVKGITGQHVVIELGGVTQEQYAYTETVRNRLDRISGLTATVQGAVGTADTATEAQIASDALTNRVGYLRQRVLVATQHSLKRVGWYLFHTEGVVIPVNRRDMYTGELMEGLFFGGPTPDDEGAQWDDFDLRIALNTMQQEAQAKDNLLGFYQLFAQVATMAPQVPWVRWMNVLRDMAEVFKVGDLPDEWMIPEIFGAFSQPPQMPPSAVMGGRQPTAQIGGTGASAPAGAAGGQPAPDMASGFGRPGGWQNPQGQQAPGFRGRQQPMEAA